LEKPDFLLEIELIDATVREMITAKLKQQDRQWQDFGPPTYRKAV
jgi:hypothetical protein